MVDKVFSRFSSKVIRLDSGCWKWNACILKSGYGGFNINRRCTLAHRFSFEHFRYKIPDGLQIDHLCRNRWCVNPFHLEPVTAKTNILRGVGASARNAKKTHCKQGHPYTPENTYYPKSGGRWCWICRREAIKRANAKQCEQYGRKVPFSMSRSYDKMKAVRLLPETVELIKKFINQNPMCATTPRLVNMILCDWLKGRVK